MKKSKLIMPIVAAATTAAAIAPALALSGCSCSTSVNAVEVVNSASKTVAKKSAYATFKFKQSNLKDAESTKVKIANLKIDGAEAASVSGLIKSTADSAGNIVVRFNMDLARTQYGSSFEKITFDLQFTNKQASTSYTLTGFSVAVDTSGWAITYTGDDQVNFNDENPTSVDSNNPEDLEINYSFDTGYKFNSAVVTINGVDKTSQCVEKVRGLSFIIPKEIIDGEININITSTKMTYTFIEPTDTIPGIESVTAATPTYHEKFVMTFKLTSGYRLSQNDFSSNIKLYHTKPSSSAEKIAIEQLEVGQYDKTTSTQTVTIAADFVEGDISFGTSLPGSKTFAVSYATEGANITTEKLEEINIDNLNTIFLAYTLKTGWNYKDPIITTNNGSTTLTKEADYVIESSANQTYKIKFISFANMGPNVKINLNLSGDFVVTGGTHELDNNSSGFTLKAMYGDIDVTNEAVWSVKSGSSVTVDQGTVKVSTTGSSAGSKIGGSSVISCKYTPTGKDPVEFEFPVSVGSFNSLNATELKQGRIAAKDTSISGSIVLPADYYDEANKTLKAVDFITQNAFTNCTGITSIYISKNIAGLGDALFGGCTNLTSIVVDPNNSKFIDAGANCIIWALRKRLCAGCKATVIPEESSVVTCIIDDAFNSVTGTTNINIPSNITEIEANAFVNSGFSTITFKDQNALFIQSNDTTNKLLLDISDSTTNANNLKDKTITTTGYNWWYTGIKVDSSAAKYADVNIVDTGFTEAGITLDTSKCTTRVVNGGAASAKDVVVAYTSALTKDVKGTVTITGKQQVWTGSVTLKSGDTSSTLVTLDTTEWGKITTQETISVTFVPVKQVTIEGDTSITQGSSSTYKATYNGTEVRCNWSLKETAPTDKSVTLDGNILKVRQWSDPTKTWTLVATPTDTTYTAAEKTISITQCGAKIELDSDYEWYAFDYTSSSVYEWIPITQYYYKADGGDNTVYAGGLLTSLNWTLSYTPAAGTATVLTKDSDYSISESTAYRGDYTKFALTPTTVTPETTGTINIKGPTLTDKDKFIKLADKWEGTKTERGGTGFINASTQYDPSQITITDQDGTYSCDSVGCYYDNYVEGKRVCTASYNKGAAGTTSQVIAQWSTSGTQLDEDGYLKDPGTEGVTYTIADDYVEYTDTGASQWAYSRIKINKYGYWVARSMPGLPRGDYELTLSSDAPTVDTKPLWFDKNEYPNDYCSIVFNGYLIIVDNNYSFSLSIENIATEAIGKKLRIHIKSTDDEVDIQLDDYTIPSTMQSASFTLTAAQYALLDKSKDYTITFEYPE